ncbi:MAG: hypothetical protein RLZZ312_730 [Bacteroidota bacterium]
MRCYDCDKTIVMPPLEPKSEWYYYKDVLDCHVKRDCKKFRLDQILFVDKCQIVQNRNDILGLSKKQATSPRQKATAEQSQML